MEWLIAVALLAALVLLFGDILLMLAIRIGMFLLMLWIVCLIQKSVASVLVESGLITHEVAANLNQAHDPEHQEKHATANGLATTSLLIISARVSDTASCRIDSSRSTAGKRSR